MIFNGEGDIKMGNYKYKKIMLLLLGCMFLGSLIYFNTPYYIKRHRWKNLGGGRISDLMTFENDTHLSLKWPKIYKNGQYVGYVIFCAGNHLWIYSMEDERYNQTGLGEYKNKGIINNCYTK